MANNMASALKEELKKLKSNVDSSFSAMEASIDRIRKAVAIGACTWNDLEITEEQFALLDLQCLYHQLDSVVGAYTKTRNRVKGLVHGLRNGAYDNNPSIAKATTDVITKMAAMGGLTWEETGTTREELDKLLKETKQ